MKEEDLRIRLFALGESMWSLMFVRTLHGSVTISFIFILIFDCDEKDLGAS